MSPVTIDEWEMVAGSPIIEGDTLGMKGTAKWIGPFTERYLFVFLVFNTPQNFFLDQREDDPNYTTLTGMRPVSFKAVPYGGDKQLQQARGPNIFETSLYDKALVTIQFASPVLNVPEETDPNDPRGQGDYISEHLEPTGEMQTLDPELFMWEDGTDLLEFEAPGMFVAGQDYVFTRHSVDEIRESIFSLENHVNNADLRTVTGPLGGKVFAPETVLYRGASLQRAENVFGDQTKQSVAMRFSIKERKNYGANGQPEQKLHGWNSFYRADTQRWEQMLVKSGGLEDPERTTHKNHPLGDLQLL